MHDIQHATATCQPIDPQLTNTSSQVRHYRSLYARMQQYKYANNKKQ